MTGERVRIVGLCAAWVVGLTAAVVAIRLGVGGNLGMDAHAYWLAAQGGDVYSRGPGELHAYLYAPAFLTLIAPLSWMPWPLFLASWICLGVTALAWLVRPLPWQWAVPVFLACVPELVIGNIYIFLAVAAAVGLRAPAAWAFPVLTKIAPALGPVWFAARGEWRRVAEAAGVTAAVVAVSYALDPAAWHGWVRFLASEGGGAGGLVLRSLVAVALVVVGARLGWAWVLPVAMVLAAPVPALPTLAMLAAIPRLVGGAPAEAPSEVAVAPQAALLR